MAKSESHLRLGETLRAAINEMEPKLSIRQLASLLAGDGASRDRVESERRKLGRYLAGAHAPEPETARRLSAILGKPPDYFLIARPEKVELAAQLRDLAELLEDLNRLLEEQRGEAVATELRRFERRLSKLSGEVSAAGKETVAALQGVARRLGRIEADLASQARVRARPTQGAKGAAK